MPYSGIKDYIKKWANTDNCNPTPKYTETDVYEEYRYTNGDCETEVVLYSVKGRDHVPTNEEFHTSNAIWNFCKQYTNGCGKIRDGQVKGDVNLDGSLNTSDVVAVYTYIEKGEFSGFTQDAANVNGDTYVNTADVVAIYSLIINGSLD